MEHMKGILAETSACAEALAHEECVWERASGSLKLQGAY